MDRKVYPIDLQRRQAARTGIIDLEQSAQGLGMRLAADHASLLFYAYVPPEMPTVDE